MIWLLFGLVTFGLAYDWLTTYWLRRWLLPQTIACIPHSPVTFFRPLKRHVPELEVHLRDFFAAVYLDDQILFGVHSDDLATQQILQKILPDFPQLDLQIVHCLPDLARNPKINKLFQLTPHARHDHWVVMDSEIENASQFLPNFRSEWTAHGYPVLSAPYRFRQLTLVTAPILHTLLPGLAVLLVSGKIKNALGACIAVTRQQINALGGWVTLGNELAEDYQLGHRLAALGHRVAYSTSIVQLANDPPSHSSFSALHRQSATYRHCQPWGFAGSLVTHSHFWCLLTFPFLAFGKFCMLLALISLSRLLVCHLRARILCWPLPFWKSLVLIPLCSVLDTLLWFFAWLPIPIRWAGKEWTAQKAQSP